MQTFEGRKINQNLPLSEYPTPQFRRDSYLCLNGKWDFRLIRKNGNVAYDGDILVPFAVEWNASRVELPVYPGDKMVYSRKFRLPEGFRQKRVLLHFEAVDQIADVYLNGIHIAHHEGGYLPFTVDCMELSQGENQIVVEVTDDTSSPIYPRGKQFLKPKGLWYTATSGIWGTVWLESVPTQVIQSLTIRPRFDEKEVEIAVQFEGKMTSSSIRVLFGGRVVGEGVLGEDFKTIIPLSVFRPWSTERPDLYDVEIMVNYDKVHSYFGMRKFSMVEKDGHKVFALNNQPLFLSGVLDQGYFPESGLTPPTDQAMVDDIVAMKDLGFNMLRKHIKIEPMRWYYHCDRLGMIVNQDMVNGGSKYKQILIYAAPFLPIHFDDTKSYKTLGRGKKESRAFFEAELPEAIKRLRNCPCIAIWTLFNEGWGQFDSVRLTNTLRELDPTRLIDSTSGWYDQGAGDFLSRHVYMKKIKLKPSSDRMLALTEFGGYSWRLDDHAYAAKNFGYATVKDQKDLEARIAKLFRKQVIPAKAQGLCMTVYTQLCDVEGETNGLLTYDRKVTKVSQKLMVALNGELKA